MEWTKTRKSKPSHKDLILAKRKDGVILPSIYYNNASFCGFYPYTTYYSNHKENDFYSEVITETKFKNIVEWMLIPE